jgi:acyl-CoA thioesterase-1
VKLLRPSRKFAPEYRFASSRFATWRYFILGAVLTVSSAIAFPVADAATSSQRLMVYGDSLSAAYGIDPKDGWVSLLQARLQPEGVTVVNASISGETTSGGLNRIKTDLARIRPNVVVLALGANDGLRGLPIIETRKNLQSMISSIQAANARVVLIGIQIPPNYGIDYSRQFRDLYFELARSNHVSPPPFLLEGIADKLELFQADRLHPKAEAQPAILDNVLPVIRKALNKPAPASRTPAQS